NSGCEGTLELGTRKMPTTIQIKRGTEATMPAALAGEPALTTDTHKLFVGGYLIGPTAGGGGTVTSVGLTAPAAGITVSGSPITTAGSITLALANDLAALEGLTATGLAARTAADTWAARTLTAGSAKVSIANGAGVAGNPTVHAVQA